VQPALTLSVFTKPLTRGPAGHCALISAAAAQGPRREAAIGAGLARSLQRRFELVEPVGRSALPTGSRAARDA
jgi:hypothetical protein